MLILFWDWVTRFFSGDGKTHGMLDADPPPPPDPGVIKNPIGG